MKKILLLFLMTALLPIAIAAQELDGTFTVSDLTYDADMEGYYFTVGMEGSSIYTAYNLDIFLPDGINVMSDPEVGYYVLMSEDTDIYTYNKVKKTWSHSVECSMPTANQLRVACFSGSNVEFKGGTGDLFIVYVTINESAFTSSFSPMPIVKLSGMNLTTKTEIAYHPADFACRPFMTGIPASRTLPVNVSAANKVGTLILPFDADIPSGLKAYTCNSLDGDLLTLTPAASFEACTPYIVYAESGYSGNLSGTAELTDNDNVTDVFADGYLTGVLTGTTVSTGYILQNQGEGPMFYDAEGVAFSLPAGRCYLTPPASPVKSFTFSFETETKVDEIINSPLGPKGRFQSDAGKESSIFNFFDLQGRPVLSPTRGIYIQGMRKVVVK